MLVSGKRFVCTECNHTVEVHYEGGTLMTQIGDFEVMRQMQIQEELSDEGAYLYDFGLCTVCYEQNLPQELKDRVVQIDLLIDKLGEHYNTVREKIAKHFEELLTKVEENLSFEDLSEITGGLNLETFIDTRQHKGKRRSPLKDFLREYSEEIEHAMLQKVWREVSIHSVTRQYTQETHNIFKQLNDILSMDNSYYYHKDTDNTENLNDYIMTDTSVRVPVEGSASERFYYETSFDCKEIMRAYWISPTDYSLPKGMVTSVVERIVNQAMEK